MIKKTKEINKRLEQLEKNIATELLDFQKETGIYISILSVSPCFGKEESCGNYFYFTAKLHLKNNIVDYYNCSKNNK